jgi:hypothetical protein
VNVKVSVPGRAATTLVGETVMVPAAGFPGGFPVADGVGLDVTGGVVAVASDLTLMCGDDPRRASFPPLADSSEVEKVERPAEAGAVPAKCRVRTPPGVNTAPVIVISEGDTVTVPGLAVMLAVAGIAHPDGTATVTSPPARTPHPAAV